MKNKEKKVSYYFARFCIILVISMIIGGIMGIILSQVDENDILNNLSVKNISIIKNVIVTFFAVFNIIFSIISFVLYYNTANRAAKLTENDEDEMMDLEKKISLPLSFGSLAVIVDMMLFSLSTYSIHKAGDIAQNCYMWSIICILSFAYSLVWTIVISNLCVNFEKRINPEKRGNIFDTKFQKNWFDSCDEGEREQIYKCSYKSYCVTSKFCIIMWLVAFAGMLGFDSGWLPIVLVCLIWLVSTGSYLIEARKLENK